MDMQTPTTPYGHQNVTRLYNMDPATSTVAQNVVLIIMGLGIMILLENFLVLVAAVRNKKLRDNIHYNLVLFLSVSDFLLGFNILLYTILYIDKNISKETRNRICIINICLWCTTIQMSLLQIFFISLNRYLVISERKLNKMLWNGNRKYVVYLVSWVGIVVIITSLLSPTNERCHLTSFYGANFYIFQPLYFSINSFFLCMTIIFYIMALKSVLQKYRKTSPSAAIAIQNISSNNGQDQMYQLKRRRIIKSMKLVSTVVGTLFFLSGPMAFLGTIASFSQIGNLLLSFGVTINAVVNPVIYCTQIEELKNEIKALFKMTNRR